MLFFICRVKAQTERKTLIEAARRCHSVWLPFSLQSTRPKRKRAPVAVARPIMQYMFVQSDRDQMFRLLQYKDVFAPVWFINERQRPAIEDYMRKVEKEFTDNLKAYRQDARAFHCSFKPGQAVKLKQEGLELFDAEFRRVLEDGRYELEAEMMGQKVPVMAEPHHVTA